MKNINVLMIGSDLTVKGGMTTVVQNFLKHKFKNNIKITYIPTHLEKSILIKFIFFFKAILNILIRLLFTDIDIVHIHMSERGSFYRKNIIVNLSKKFRKKIIIHMHGAEFKEFYNLSSEKRKKNIVKMLLSADRVIVLGEEWEKYFLKLDCKIKTEIFRNSVDVTDKTISINNNKINILFLAVLTERKGIFDLIEAAKLIFDNNSNFKDNVKFIIAGTGDKEEECKKLINQYGIVDNFEFKGWIVGDEKNRLLESSQIFILPSYNEGLPMSILEAMSYGLPIISTNVGSIQEAVKNGVNGYIVSPGEINQIYNKLEKCILDNKLRRVFSINSKIIVEKLFNNEEYFKNIENLYFNLSKKGGNYEAKDFQYYDR